MVGMTASLVERDLRSAGLRVTKQRVAVLAAIRRQPHADADTLIGSVRTQLGGVSTQAVYDVLHALEDAGLARRVEPAGSPARYDPRVGDNHHHLVCRACGFVADVDCAIGDPPCLTANDSRGFVIDEAEITYWGLCPACHAATSTAIGAT
jgi:Fur family transcriptional regulator, stress-responsive regulator